MSIKMTYYDGYWYVDVRLTTAAHYQSYSRHTTFAEAVEQIRLIALTNGVEI